MPFIFVLALIFVAVPAEAWAYIDAGIGSIIVQLLVGGLAGGLVIVKLYWQKLKSLFGVTSDSHDESPNSQ